MILFGDLETYSEKPLKHGTYQYAESCEIMLFAWAIDDGPVSVWDLAVEPEMPPDLEDALVYAADEIVFQNSMFDRSVFRLATNSRPLMRGVGNEIHRWRDTMVQALAHSMPGGLEKLGEVLKIDQDKRKLKEGKDLVQLFCKPRPKNMKTRRATRETHPVEWARFVEYAANDIEAMRVIYRKAPRWNYKGFELDLWHLDQRINDRGICVDLDLAHAAIEATTREQARLKDVTQEMTAGYVESATQRDKLLGYLLMEYGVDLPNLQKDTLERRIEDADLPIEMRELLAVRLQASTASTAKYKAVVRGVNSDGRLRGLLQFCGAQRTGRWAGRTFQPQNLSRVPKYLKKMWDETAEMIKTGAVDLVFDNPMEVLGSLVRGVIVPGRGRKMVVGDLANIEGRVAAWLVGEDWKLVKFEEYDAGVGADLYKVAYSKAFGITPEEVDDLMRQIGKVMELMLQYEGGVGAFLTGAATYGIDLDAMAETALPTIPSHVLQESIDFYDWTCKKKRSTFGLERETFLACDALKRLWRGAHPAISSYWGELADTVRKAIGRPGETFTARRLKIRRDGAWLRIQLPSGRSLCYPSPQVDEGGKISYMGVNQYSRKWSRISTYGGKLFENCIAEGTRVLTREGWLTIEAVGPNAEVWDGVEWVRQGGAVYRGKRPVISRYSVTMTPDHLVLTEKGWRHASSCEGHNRACCGLPDGYEVPRVRRGQIGLGSEVPLWQGGADTRHRTGQAKEPGHNSLVRLHEACDHSEKEQKARDVGPSRVLGLEVDGGPLLAALAPCLEKLRRAWNQGVRTLAGVVRELLERHGSYLPARLYAGAQEQLNGVLTGELRLAHATSPSEQPTRECLPGHPARSNDSERSRAVLQHRAQHPELPFVGGVGSGTGADPAPELQQSAVYDLLNCGPRNRFVVLGRDGRALIVHNCTQAVARDVLAWNMPRVEAAGYEIVLSVHDELITETPDTDDYSVDGLCDLMAAVPEWAEGLPLSSAGFEGYRYRKD